MKTTNFFALALLLCSAPAFAVTIVNGDFSQGTLGFNSQYTKVDPASNGNVVSGLWPEGTITADFSAAVNHPLWSVFGERDGGTGKYLLINGSPSSNAFIWSQTVSGFEVGSTYSLLMYAASLYPASPSVPQLWVGTSLNNLQAIGTPKQLSDTPGIWELVAADFVATSNQMVVAFSAGTTIRYGNDFAVDDISLHKGSLEEVPEPSTYMLLGAGLLGLGALQRRKR